MNSNQAVCERIKELCEKHKISRYTLAYRAAIPKSTLMNIFKGTNPTTATICKICNGFGITMSEFFQSEFFEKCEEE